MATAIDIGLDIPGEIGVGISPYLASEAGLAGGLEQTMKLVLEDTTVVMPAL